MKIEINYDLCEANAICMGIAPEVFEVRDDDNLYILDEDPSEDLRPKLEEAARRCPKQAITIEG
jgi:ferredoxin